MTDRTAPVVLLNEKEQQWLDGAIKDKLLRYIEFDDMEDLKMGVASGGFGVIHSGKWRDMKVAVKVLYNPADFIQEVGIHKLVQDSENIVKFYGITRMRSSGDYGMVLQFANKGSLRDFLSQQFSSLDWTDKVRLARDVAAGISFIHQDNICHHDLHSRNVLVDQSGRALITDFGLSRYLNHASSNNGVRGVVPYISPERLKNHPFDRSSDIYSLGVIMWELTSGQPPFSRESEHFLLPYEIIKGRRETPIPGTPEQYSNLYIQCWNGEPLQRPPVRDIVRMLNLMVPRVAQIAPAESTGGFKSHGDCTGSVSLPNSTNTESVTIVQNQISEPIVPPRTIPDDTKGGSPIIASVKPLHVLNKQQRSATVGSVDGHFTLVNQMCGLKVAEENKTITPTTPHGPIVRPLWITSPNNNHGNSTLVRPISPKPPSSYESAKSKSINNVSATLSEIPIKEDMEEMGSSPSMISKNPYLIPVPTIPNHFNGTVGTNIQNNHQNNTFLNGGTNHNNINNNNHNHNFNLHLNLSQGPAHPNHINPGYNHQHGEMVFPPMPQPQPVIAPLAQQQQQQQQIMSPNPGFRHPGELVNRPTPMERRTFPPVSLPAHGTHSIPPIPHPTRGNSLPGASSQTGQNPFIPRDGRSRIKDFFYACRGGNVEAVKWHLDHGANVMEQFDVMSSRTSLHAAAMSDSLEVMKLLVEAAGPKLNIDELDDGSQTPLHLLTQFGRDSDELLVYLLQLGANPNAQDSDRRTPLMTAVILNDNAFVVETLLDYGADPNLKCQENNALAEAAIRLKYNCVKVLLDTDLSMSEQYSLEHAMDVCYRVTESLNRNQVLGLLVRWKGTEGLQKRVTLATMILRGSIQFGEKRIDQRRLARQVLQSASNN